MSWLRHWLCSCALLFLSACTAAPATQLYLLRPVANPLLEKPTPTGRQLVIVIHDVRLPQYLDRPQIVTRGKGDRLVINEYAHWGSNFRDEMTRVLAESLEALLAGSRVMVAPIHRHGQPDYRIELEVTHFERQVDGQVRLKARWWITGGTGSAPVTADATLNAMPAGDTYEALVASMSTAYGELAQSIAASVRRVDQ